MEENKYITQLKKIILDYAENTSVKIYIFGSRAKGISRTSSDVDIAFLPENALPKNFIADLSEIIENSSIPYHVDLVDLTTTDEEFRNKVLKEAITWKD